MLPKEDFYLFGAKFSVRLKPASECVCSIACAIDNGGRGGGRNQMHEQVLCVCKSVAWFVVQKAACTLMGVCPVRGVGGSTISGMCNSGHVNREANAEKGSLLSLF